MLMKMMISFVVVCGFLGGDMASDKKTYLDGLKGERRTGIVFFRSQMVNELEDFYTETLGCRVWQRQDGVVILRFGSLLFGLHQSEPVDRDALLSFTLETRESVDRAYRALGALADGGPKLSEKYGIYHFFARDPEGRKIEFQTFISPIDWTISRDH